MVIRTSSTSAPWVRSRLRSIIGLEIDTASPLPLPGPLPPPKNEALNVGTSSGTTTATPVAVSPILRAEAQTAWLLTVVVWVSKIRPPGESWCPQCESRWASSEAIRNRKHSAAAANFSQDTPPSRTLTGAVYSASSGSPASGARRRPDREEVDQHRGQRAGQDQQRVELRHRLGHRRGVRLGGQHRVAERARTARAPSDGVGTQPPSDSARGLPVVEPEQHQHQLGERDHDGRQPQHPQQPCPAPPPSGRRRGSGP